MPRLSNPRLFSLKVEALRLDASGRFGLAVRRYVDAIVLDAQRIIAVPFIQAVDPGAPVFQRLYAALPSNVLEALGDAVVKWLSDKAHATLEATMFLKDAEIEAAIVASDTNHRAFPGLAPYSSIFDEAERYANLTPYVRGRHVLDCNPGYGYGPSTLLSVARSVRIDFDAAHPVAQRIWQQGTSPRPEIATFLDAGTEVALVLASIRESAPSAEMALLSVRGEHGEEALRAQGGETVRMRRPGCDALGDLEETLGIFRLARARIIPVGTVTLPERVAATVAPQPLRVLFALRPSSQQVFGGDVVQVRETARALERRGHFVEISTSLKLEADNFDVVHLSNLTVPDLTLPQAESVCRFKGAVVIMPIFTDHGDETAWGMDASIAAFLASRNREELNANLDALERRAIVIAGKQPPPARVQMIPHYEEMQRRILDCTDYAIANAHAEMHRVYRYLNCEIPYSVVPSCADPKTYGSFRREEFITRYGLCDFVLIAGRYEPRKNQLMLFEALRGLDHPLVCIGANHDADTAYIVRLRRPADASYIGFLPESDLAGAFAAARVVATPSWDEVVSLTSLNAAVSQASMVLTRNSYEHEYFGDDAEYCDPGSVSSIRRAVTRAWETHEARRLRRQQLAERVRQQFSWDEAARLTEDAYYRVLAFNPRGERRLGKGA